MRHVSAGAIVLSGCLLAGVWSTTLSAEPGDSRSWSAKAAAASMDARQAWWAAWPSAERDRCTFCVSCPTALPYALARPALRPALGERQASAAEAALVDNVLKRVRMWNEVAPFYPGQTRGIPKTTESRGTESVLNAAILAGRDARDGALSADAHTAFANIQKALRWPSQHQDGATGRWLATSLNKRRDLETDAGRFMGDAATAYAVLALTAADAH